MCIFFNEVENPALFSYLKMEETQVTRMMHSAELMFHSVTKLAASSTFLNYAPVVCYFYRLMTIALKPLTQKVCMSTHVYMMFFGCL
jgi:hypothetical protein